MNLITFVFSGFWVWLGFVILVGLVLQQVVEMIKAIRTQKQVEAYRIGERWHFKVTGASKADIKKMMKRAGVGAEASERDNDDE